MNANRRLGWALFFLLVGTVSQGHGQPFVLPPPFERNVPPGDPPPVPNANAPLPGKEPEVLPRGPLHEGFAPPTTEAPKRAPVLEKEPPPMIREVPPREKPEGANVVWLPGYWAWEESRNDYVWVSGFWRVPPVGRFWKPGQWTKVEGGWSWVAGRWISATGEGAPLASLPPESLERGPTVPSLGTNQSWIPGIWLSRDDRWLWRPGYWVPVRPGFLYTPARYQWTPSGYVLVDGYWDVDLPGRGSLYAPVWFPPGYRFRPGYYWTPRQTISINLFTGPLWDRPGLGALPPGGAPYRFGDLRSPGNLALPAPPLTARSMTPTPPTVGGALPYQSHAVAPLAATHALPPRATVPLTATRFGGVNPVVNYPTRPAPTYGRPAVGPRPAGRFR